MIRTKEDVIPSEIVIDLDGPDGNAFALIGAAVRFAKQLCYEKVEIEKLKREMMSGDYDNLVEVFKTNFGQLVRLVKIENGYVVETLN